MFVGGPSVALQDEVEGLENGGCRGVEKRERPESVEWPYRKEKRV